jgi:ectoine hydroxylase-related dioxygenase (phytanoyl-CoA dioxygenase family)
MQPTPRLIDPQLEADLDRDGYAVIAEILDADEIEQLAAVYRASDSPIHRSPFGASILSDDLAYRDTVDREVAAVVRPKVDRFFNAYRYCFANFLGKVPVTGAVPDSGVVPLHQDIALVDERKYQSLGLWIPLVDVDERNGCLSVIPGSQHLNNGPRGPGLPFPYRDLEPVLHTRTRSVPMKAGSAMVFCQKLFHTSRPNRGDAPRPAVGALLAPAEAQLYCYYPQDTPATRMEVFAVDDHFYTRYGYRTRPQAVPQVGVIDYWYDRIDPARLPAA